MIYLAVLAFGVTLGLPIAVIFASTAQGRATSTALEGIARQPESAPRIQTAMIIGLALIESLVIYALLMFFILQAKLPEGDVLKQMIDSDAQRVTTQQR
ncbi:ATP synthase F0 subunit C [Candidatus Poribacteria bacterium]|nr:MAG: ATP synthase F0 subunit C [Candidatus Poribacteria bacterium]